MYKTICKYLTLLMPSLLCVTWIYLASNHNMMNHDLVLLIISIAAYMISVAGIVLHVKFKPFNVWLVPISFLISPILVYLYEHPGGGFLPFIGTGIVLVLYTIPFTLISVITAIVVSASSLKTEKRCRSWTKKP